MTLDVDVLALSEITPPWLDTLHDASGATRFPYRDLRLDGGSEDVAIFARCRIDVIPVVSGLSAVAAIVDLKGSPVTVLAVHLPSPFEVGRARWLRSHQLLWQTTDTLSPPTIAIGDFNSLSRQRPMRSLERRGFVDVRQSLGAETSGSWPAWLPLLRLDHAFVTPPLRPRFVTDFAVPGSDHRGLIIDIAVPVKHVEHEPTAANTLGGAPLRSGASQLWLTTGSIDE
jgi:hypothetical protein